MITYDMSQQTTHNSNKSQVDIGYKNNNNLGQTKYNILKIAFDTKSYTQTKSMTAVASVRRDAARVRRRERTSVVTGTRRGGLSYGPPWAHYLGGY
jgi:hypothetical protein